MKIVFFTDCMSISPNSISDSLKYPQLIAQKYPFCTVVIKGSSGTTTGDSINSLDEILKLSPDLVVYGYGVNDALPRGLYREQRAKLIRAMFKAKLSKKKRLFVRKYFLNPLEYILQFINKPKHYLSKLETENNINTCIEAFKRIESDVIVLNINPVCNYRFVHANRHITNYNDLISKKTLELNVDLVDVFKVLNKNNLDDVLAEDKFHYSELAHQLVANELIEIMEEKYEVEFKNMRLEK